MSSLLQSVDERTNLAGANRLEILLFSLGKDTSSGREEVFGINVFKIREVMHLPEVTRAPDMPPGVMGMVSLRGNMIPVIDLVHFCGVEVEEPPGILIVTEYNRNTQGLLVHSVEQILRMEWNEIKVPPLMMGHAMGGLVTAVTELNDGRIVMIIDVERVLSETAGCGEDESVYKEIVTLEQVEDHPKNLLYADDSMVARKQIEKTLDKMGVNYTSAKNGDEAWARLGEIAERAKSMGVPVNEILDVVLTDVEMPSMDGYVLTKKIKSDPRFNGVPVVMHSSLSADANITMGTNVGADAYVAKFDPRELASVLDPFFKKGKE
ncbi:MAG: chemotaxis protein [Gammaproteobacteria bacterium]|nr:MAG: chemotaxis protein [Gammaproteobacteria bacterium]